MTVSVSCDLQFFIVGHDWSLILLVRYPQQAAHVSSQPQVIQVANILRTMVLNFEGLH